MTTLSADTSPKSEAFQLEQLRQMLAWRKLALVAEMNRTVRTLALAGPDVAHPVFDAIDQDIDRILVDNTDHPGFLQAGVDWGRRCQRRTA